jgi:hypothetical protein
MRFFSVMKMLPEGGREVIGRGEKVRTLEK